MEKPEAKRSIRNDKIPTYRVVDWEPIENSLVTIPMDDSVGVGRSYGVEILAGSATLTAESATEGGFDMKGKTGSVDTGGEIEQGADPGAGGERLNPAAIEKERAESIRKLAQANNIDDRIASQWVQEGASFKQISDEILQILAERGRNPNPVTRIGMSGNETERYSLVRAIVACASGNWSKAGLEAEASKTVAEKLGKSPDERSFFVPFELMQRRLPVQQRDLSAGTASAGGYLVDTQNMSFIELLYARSVMLRLGARRLPGLVSNVAIPRLDTGGTAYWLATEATAITETNQVFGQVTMSPKNVGGYTEISRQLMMQSQPAAESIVNGDLARAVALAVDAAGLEGDGTGGAPTGIASTAGIGAVTGTSLGYAGILNFQEDVAAAEVMPMSGGYATTAAVASLLMQRVKFTGTASPLWEGNLWNGSVAGFPAMSSSQLTAATAIFGDWSEAILGEWGVLEIEVNPFANFQAAITGVRAIYSVDWAIRHAGAFSRATVIT
jgi:HK97 family phage major capsid protein